MRRLLTNSNINNFKDIKLICKELEPLFFFYTNEQVFAVTLLFKGIARTMKQNMCYNERKRFKSTGNISSLFDICNH